MILSVKFQAMVFLAAFASGAGFAMCYDVLRLFRIYAAHRPITIQIEDLIYWLVCSFVFFNMLLEINNGEMRFYIPFGFFCGMALYFVTLGRIVMRFARAIIDFVIKLVRLFIEIITTPFRLVWIVIRKPVLFLWNLFVRVLILVRDYVKMLNIPKRKKRVKLCLKKSGKRR